MATRRFSPLFCYATYHNVGRRREGCRMQVEAAAVTPAPRMSRDLRAAQLLDVVEALTLQEGASAVTMERIADLAGVAKPVVYRHFGNAGAALLAVLERRWAAIDPGPRRHLPGRSGFRGQRPARRRALPGRTGRRPLPDPQAARDRHGRSQWSTAPTARGWTGAAATLPRSSPATSASAPGAAVTLATFCIGALSRLGDKVHEAPETARAQADRFAKFITGGLRAAAGGGA